MAEARANFLSFKKTPLSQVGILKDNNRVKTIQIGKNIPPNGNEWGKCPFNFRKLSECET